MNEIESKKKEHFMKTFSKADDNFQKIFSSLFTKGKAYLELENFNSPFEGGLSVKVKLTGNRFMDIKSLSGGEKTLTALSFIFAIQEYQPALILRVGRDRCGLWTNRTQTCWQS